MKLTRWFPLAKAKPVRVGPYNTSCLTEGQSGSWYCYWDGEKFTGLMQMDPDSAYENRNEAVDCRTSRNPHIRSWRGIDKS